MGFKIKNYGLYPLALGRYLSRSGGGSGPTFILDTVTALNGYSLRKLKSTATKSIRVRRSSDNAEQDIGFVGEDLDESALTTFVGANDGYVVTLYNQVDDGASKNYIQASAVLQPKIVEAGNIIKTNDKPTLNFGEITTARMDSTITVSQPFVISAILEPLASGNDRRYATGGIILQWTSPDVFRALAGGTLATSNVGTLRLFNVYNYLSGTNSDINVNGTNVNGNAGTSGTSNLQLGTSFNGYISEFIILQSDTEGETLRTNQNTYYSIV